MHRIAKIDDARDFLVIAGIDEDVPVVAVIVNDLGTQARKPGLDLLFEGLDEALQNRPFGRVLDEVQACPRTGGVAQIPVQIAHRAGVHETLQRPIDLTEGLAKAAHQFEGTLDLGHRRAVQPADQAHRMGLAGGRHCRGEEIAGQALL
ncbi:hypothetical protein D3C81_1735000 [compost metagenome]